MNTNKNTKNIIGKDQFSEKLATKLDTSLAEAKRLYDTFFDTFIETIKSKKDIRVVGLGTFSVIKQKERNGINPQTQKPLIIPSKLALKFKVSSVLKKNIKGKTN